MSSIEKCALIKKVTKHPTQKVSSKCARARQDRPPNTIVFWWSLLPKTDIRQFVTTAKSILSHKRAYRQRNVVPNWVCQMAPRLSSMRNRVCKKVKEMTLYPFIIYLIHARTCIDRKHTDAEARRSKKGHLLIRPNVCKDSKRHFSLSSSSKHNHYWSLGLGLMCFRAGNDVKIFPRFLQTSVWATMHWACYHNIENNLLSFVH